MFNNNIYLNYLLYVLSFPPVIQHSLVSTFKCHYYEIHFIVCEQLVDSPLTNVIMSLGLGQFCFYNSSGTTDRVL